MFDDNDYFKNMYDKIINTYESDFMKMIMGDYSNELKKYEYHPYSNPKEKCILISNPKEKSIFKEMYLANWTPDDIKMKKPFSGLQVLKGGRKHRPLFGIRPKLRRIK